MPLAGPQPHSPGSLVGGIGLGGLVGEITGGLVGGEIGGLVEDTGDNVVGAEGVDGEAVVPKSA